MVQTLTGTVLEVGVDSLCWWHEVCTGRYNGFQRNQLALQEPRIGAWQIVALQNCQANVCDKNDEMLARGVILQGG